MKLAAGITAPDFSIPDIFGNLQTPSPDDFDFTLLSFFRYAECPLCNLRVSKMTRSTAEIEKYKLKVIGVFESSPASLKHSIVDGHQFPFSIIGDTKRYLYRLYGVDPSWIKTLKAGTLSGIGTVLEAFRSGYHIGKVEGTFSQIPADFIISRDKKVIHAHYGRDVTDHLPLSSVFEILEGAQSGSNSSSTLLSTESGK